MILAEQQSIPDELSTQRFDIAVASMYPQFSRSFISAQIKSGNILLDNTIVKAKQAVLSGQIITLKIEMQTDTIEPENKPIDIVYVDEHIAIINKPVGLVVHPGAGHFSNTLIHRLLHHFPQVEQVTRFGLVHRIDKDTSGLLVVALSMQAHNILSEQIALHEIKRVYCAYVHGFAKTTMHIDAPIARSSQNRKKMAVQENGKQATTYATPAKIYMAADQTQCFTKMICQLETGRTHQIRVHLHYKGFPIIGDQTYGCHKTTYKRLPEYIANFSRQALHAQELELLHPISEEHMQFSAPQPADLFELETYLDELHAK